jgi:hypothetical protein
LQHWLFWAAKHESARGGGGIETEKTGKNKRCPIIGARRSNRRPRDEIVQIALQHECAPLERRSRVA